MKERMSGGRKERVRRDLLEKVMEPGKNRSNMALMICSLVSTSLYGVSSVIICCRTIVTKARSAPQMV